MAHAVPSSSSHLLFSASLSSISRVYPLPLHCHRPSEIARIGAVRLRAVSAAATRKAESKIGGKEKGQFYQVQNLTTWLLRQEQSGQIDSELTIVLSSISLACEQIASLVRYLQRVVLQLSESSGRTQTITSEEEDIPVAVEETYSGNYIVVFDPIDTGLPTSTQP